MRLAIGADHAGFELKESIAKMLRADGHDLLDLGTHSTAPVDYPDFAAAVGRAVVDGQVERGVLICGSGVGASVAANKIVGVRAGLCHDTYSAAQSVEHDDANVLVLGARVIGRPWPRCSCARSSRRVSRVRERHRRRLEKVRALESGLAQTPA